MNDLVKSKERIGGGFMGMVYRVTGSLGLDLAYLLKFAITGK